MIRFLIQTAVFLASAAIGLLAASVVVNGVEVHVFGFISAVVIYAVIQAIISPFLLKVAAKNATAFLGGTGLVASFIALLIASLVSNGLSITGGVGTWIAATIIVWLVTAIATFTLPFILVKSGVEAARAKKN
jgi:hypothetical protein